MVLSVDVMDMGNKPHLFTIRRTSSNDLVMGKKVTCFALVDTAVCDLSNGGHVGSLLELQDSELTSLREVAEDMDRRPSQASKQKIVKF